MNGWPIRNGITIHQGKGQLGIDKVTNSDFAKYVCSVEGEVDGHSYRKEFIVELIERGM